MMITSCNLFLQANIFLLLTPKHNVTNKTFAYHCLLLRLEPLFCILPVDVFFFAVSKSSRESTHHKNIIIPHLNTLSYSFMWNIVEMQELFLVNPISLITYAFGINAIHALRQWNPLKYFCLQFWKKNKCSNFLSKGCFSHIKMNQCHINLETYIISKYSIQI